MPRNKKSRNLDRWVRRNQGKHLCQCGCGEYVVVKREHHKKSVGIPKFIKGHNLKPKDDFPAEVIEERDSLWDKLTPEEQQRRLNQLKNFERGEANPSWKGGRRVDERGYVQLLMPEHPMAKDGYIAEHRFVVEERTKRYYPGSPLLVEVGGEKHLRSSAVVHHIDEVKDNNDPGSGPGDDGNLMLLPNQAAHAFIHMSPLPMEERLRRIAMGVFHSGSLSEGDEC